MTVPLEEAINGVQGLRYIQSSSGSDGSSHDHRDVQPRPRPRPSRERRAERGEPRARPAAERGQASRRHGVEELGHVRRRARRHVDRRALGSGVPHQLPREQRRQRPQAHQRRLRRARVRRAQVRDAPVGRSQAPRRQRPHRRRRRHRAAGAERPGRGRRDRRAADERPPGARVLRARDGPAARRDAVRQHRAQDESRRRLREGARRRARRARRRELRRLAVVRRQGSGRARHPAVADGQRAGGVAAGARDDGPAVGEVSGRRRATRSRSTPAISCASRSRRS